MSVSIDVTGVSEDRYLFAPSPLAELGSALHLLVEPAHHATQHGWITAAAARLDADLMDRILVADYLWRTSRADMLLPARPQPSLAAELDTLDSLDDETWVSKALMTSSCGVVPLLDGLGSPLVDPAAREIALERAAARGPRPLEFVEHMLADPAATRTWVRHLLEDCEAGFFADAWSRVSGSLATDARHKSDLLARHGLARTLTAVSPALSLVETGGGAGSAGGTGGTGGTRIVVDKLQDRSATAGGAGLTFLPSAFSHPHLLVVHAPGWQPVIYYPLLATPTEPGVSVASVQDRLHALDHPLRLRLVRSILRGPQTTTQLADTWMVSAPEVSRHLAVLKNAGIITAGRQGRYVTYHFDMAGNARLGTDLIEALLR